MSNNGTFITKAHQGNEIVLYQFKVHTLKCTFGHKVAQNYRQLFSKIIKRLAGKHELFKFYTARGLLVWLSRELIKGKND